MVRRPVHSDFAPDVFVFPGGKVEAADRDPDLRPYVTIGDKNRECYEGENCFPLKVAAVRELFEEAGVLLARGVNGRLVELAGQEEARFGEYRQGLLAGDLTMLDLARAEVVRFAADLLHIFAHWITPVDFPRRYDTRFFVADLPSGQQPLHDGQETTDSIWISPHEALQRYRQGEFPLVFATEKNLERMSRYTSAHEMIAATSPADREPIMPRMIREGSDTRFLIPGDEGY